VTVLDLADPRWLAFVSASISATAFHHPAWALLLSECYGFRAFALAIQESNVITGGLSVMEVKRPLGARRWVSLPFTDHCAPLVAERDGEQLLAEASREAERSGIRQIEVHAALDRPGIHSRAEGVIHTLQLGPDPQVIRRSFHKSQVIRSISRAEKGPIMLRRGDSAADLTEVFYDLHVRTRRKQGVPVQPRRFFELLWKHMLSRGLGFVLLVYSGTTPIAGAVFLAWNGTIAYKYGASNPDYLQLRPNHLIFWEAIRWGCENGFHSFSFGRSDLDNKGLRDFKNGWGTHEEELRYSGIGGDPLGLPMEGMLGALAIVIRRSPLWVTRSLGEILYPFVA
jgi:CelD/BcsL family acetyltransferase involved in cellulose biosynthesis